MIRLIAVLAMFVAPVTVCAETFLILPLANRTSAASLDWIGESAAEALREALAQEGLLAIDREDRIEAFRRLSLRQTALLTQASVIKAGEMLDADVVVHGGFELTPGPAGAASKGSIRLSAAVLDLKRMRRGREFEAAGPIEDLAGLQRQLAWQALGTVAKNKLPSEAAFRAKWPDVRLDAMESYIRGLSAVSPEQRHLLWTQAARLDESYSQPCFQIGRYYAGRGSYREAVQWLGRVPAGAPNYREAAFHLGVARYHLGEFAAAAEAFEVVAREVPLNEVLNNLAAAQSRRGQAEALDNFQKALEGDDGDPDYHFNVGYALWRRGDFAGAANSFRAALDRNPADQEATLLLGRCLKQTKPRPGDPRSEGLERIKKRYAEMAYLQLKALVTPGPGATGRAQ
ncbi:MAG: tetratricopeptide repeat protein [Acidobacteria bacterium]|nr:tetratricopeptide repeat protein [Acidobacteriota bacterium]